MQAPSCLSTLPPLHPTARKHAGAQARTCTAPAAPVDPRRTWHQRRTRSRGTHIQHHLVQPRGLQGQAPHLLRLPPLLTCYTRRESRQGSEAACRAAQPESVLRPRCLCTVCRDKSRHSDGKALNASHSHSNGRTRHSSRETIRAARVQRKPRTARSCERRSETRTSGRARHGGKRAGAGAPHLAAASLPGETDKSSRFLPEEQDNPH